MSGLATLFEQGTANPRENMPADIPAAEAAALRRALVDCLAAVESGTPVPGNRIRAWRELAGTTYHDGLTPAERAEEGTNRAAAKWTDDEVAQVDAAIRRIARHRWTEARRRLAPAHVERLVANHVVSDKVLEFTTADVWAELGEGFPVTKGIAGRMTAAKGAGIIHSTGRTTYPPADAPGPNNGQRLTVWRAL